MRMILQAIISGIMVLSAIHGTIIREKTLMMMGLVMCLAGYGQFRFAATEAQKQNAWTHHRTCQLTQQAARDENTSPALTGLTTLAAQQSEAFVLDYGLPRERPAMEDVETVLAQAPAIAQQAASDAQRRPDAWVLTDAAMELGIGAAGLLGGVYGLRIAGFLKRAKEKGQALKEIVEGNELFKQLSPTAAADFKQAHANQSAVTRTLVTGIKSGV